MKTAISVPDATFERVTRRARELGISRSQLFAQAADQFLDQLDAVGLTEQIDAALSRLPDADDSAVAASSIGGRVLDQAADNW
jgi:metal-responsive CopG/Arc/MetJ family transcriptional regulator